MNDTIKIILPASQIPEDATVTKRTGKQEYRLTRVIKVYSNNTEERHEIAAKDGAVFLGGRAGQFNAYPGSTELVWITTRERLDYFLNPPEDK